MIPKYIYLLGAPGVGKGTQAQLLAERFNIPQLSTGDLLRDARAKGTTLGATVAQIMDSGGLVPDEIMVALVKECLSQPEYRNGAIFDGFPRTLMQAVALKNVFEEQQLPQLEVILIDVPVEEIRRRLQGRVVCPTCKHSYHDDLHPPRIKGVCDYCGSELVVRKDDQPDSVATRLELYFSLTAPLVEFYEKQEHFHRIDGTGTVDEVFKNTLDVLQKGAS